MFKSFFMCNKKTAQRFFKEIENVRPSKKQLTNRGFIRGAAYYKKKRVDWNILLIKKVKN